MTLTHHARYRCAQRNISVRILKAVLGHGRLIRGWQSEVFFLGEREVRRAKSDGLDLSFARNTQVVCGHDGAVITVYRVDRPVRGWSRQRRRGAR